MAVTYSAKWVGENPAGAFSPGWVVVRHEPGQEDQFASRVFLALNEAVAERQRLQELEDAKNA